MIIACIKDGFALANRNLQLVVIRILVSVINVTAIGVFLGIPVIVAIAYLGFDVANAGDIVPYMADNPLEFASIYLGLALLLVVAFFLYLLFASMLFLYALGGTLGSLRNSFTNTGLKFALPSFFREANANFARLLWLLSLVFLGITILLTACALIGGIMVLVMSAVSATDGTLNMFLRSFTAVFMVIVCVITLILSVLFSVYSAVIAVAEEKGAMESVKITLGFLKSRPQALLFLVILILAVIAASLLFYSVQIPLQIIPFMSVVTILINSCFSSYLTVVLWGSLVTYYMRASGAAVYDAGYEI
jgi:hypothetical protein